MYLQCFRAVMPAPCPSRGLQHLTKFLDPEDVQLVNDAVATCSGDIDGHFGLIRIDF